MTLSTLLAAPPSVLASPFPRLVLATVENGDPGKADCELNSVRGDIQHVIYIQFSRLDFIRANPNVPSDLEQMPHLLQFLENNGTVLSNHHSVLAPQSVTNALTALTGIYPERYARSFASTSSYWTTPPDANAPVNPSTNSTPVISNQTKLPPAPWAPFTRAGCNVGAVAVPKLALENTGKDILSAFGENSLEAALSADPSTVAQAAAQFLGIAIHCAGGNTLCSLGVPDLLDQSRGYPAVNALFGHKNVAANISSNSLLTDLDGEIIADSGGTPGFPGFTAVTASQSLAYLAAMQEHGVPVTFAYLSGPRQTKRSSSESDAGQAAYFAQLKSIDAAFDKFLARLAGDSINPNNTLFVVTADEGGASADAGNTTFLGLAGPGVAIKGIESQLWSDHADIRPTMMALLGLKDVYVGQGRALIEVFQRWALPASANDSSAEFLLLAQAYKRISAPASELAQANLRVSSVAQTAEGTKRNNLESQLAVVAALRNDLSAAMANLLNDATFHGRRVSEPEARQLVRSANDLLEYVKLLAANGW